MAQGFSPASPPPLHRPRPRLILVPPCEMGPRLTLASRPLGHRPPPPPQTSGQMGGGDLALVAFPSQKSGLLPGSCTRNWPPPPGPPYTVYFTHILLYGMGMYILYCIYNIYVQMNNISKDVCNMNVLYIQHTYTHQRSYIKQDVHICTVAR
jgi:hypothetical protein